MVRFHEAAHDRGCAPRLVIDPDGQDVAIDAWRIDQTDALTRLDAPDIITQDTALLTAANAAAASAPIDNVDLSAAGSPNVLRHPVTPPGGTMRPHRRATRRPAA